MKRAGIIMTTLGTLLFLATGYDLFGAKHLPVPLTVGIFLVSVVSAFLGPAIYVLTFPPERRKKIANRALVVSLLLIAVGLACTYLHVMGARVEIIVGVLTFCFFYGTLAFKSKYEKWQLYARSKRDAFFLSLFDFLGLAMLFLGSLFTFQDWHYGPQLIAFGFVVLVIGMFFWNQKFKKEVVFRKETEDKLQDSFRQIEIQHQKLEEKQKEITDSITYAKRIQYSLLANDDLLKRNLPEHFVLYKPKDIVSGDFYWAVLSLRAQSSLSSRAQSGEDKESEELFYLAVCDSTGHGVPGAFMSLLNTSFLNEAITEKKIAEPNKILDYVREKLIVNVSQDGAQDGMDGILLCIDQSTGTITYAAANNSPVIASLSGAVDCDADKMPIGKGESMRPFTLHTLNVKKGEMLYLCTDGYADQFGGDRGKKFKRSRLREKLHAICHLPVHEQRSILETTFTQWQGELEQVDDVCIIGIRF